jgi:hypothetical protein
MAKKSINLGTGYNTKDGDSVRDAFNKVNQNFDELYTLTGGTVADLTEIAQDYAAEMFVNATHTGITVNYDDDNNVLELTGFDGDYNSLTNLPTLSSFDPSAVSESIIPDTDVAYDLGSATNRFRDLYLSGSTIDLGGTTLSVVGGALQIGGTDISEVVASAGLTGQESATGDGGEIRITGGTSTDTENFGFGGSVVIQAGENPNAIQQDGGINIGTDHTNGVTIGAYDFGNGFGTIVNISGVRNNIGEPGGRSTTYLRGTIDFSDATVSELNVDLTGNFQGSIFADDSTLLVDGVNGIIPASVLDGDTTLGIIEASQLVAGTDQSISLGFKDFNGDGQSLITLSETNQIRIWGDVSVPNPAGTTIDFNNCTIENFLLSTLSSGLTAPGSAVVAGDTAINFNFSMAPTALTVEQDAITIGSGVTVNGFVGDVTGSVFASDSTLLVDGVNGKIVGPYDNGVVSINPTNVTTYDIFVQQDANTHDLYVANKIYGGETGAKTTLVIGSTTTIESDVNFNDVVKFAKTTSTGGANSGTATALDVTKTLQVLNSADDDDDFWTLADGTEGQIMHFVPGSGAGSNQHYVEIANWRRWDSDTSSWIVEQDLTWLPFKLDFDGNTWTGVATAIFVNGAWQTSNPWID